jgi:hypothetical protein
MAGKKKILGHQKQGKYLWEEWRVIFSFLSVFLLFASGFLASSYRACPPCQRGDLLLRCRRLA